MQRQLEPLKVGRRDHPRDDVDEEEIRGRRADLDRLQASPALIDNRLGGVSWQIALDRLGAYKLKPNLLRKVARCRPLFDSYRYSVWLPLSFVR